MSPQAARRKILLVEDDPATSHALRALLSRRGWDVQVASTLAEAFPKVEKGIAWVVLDLMLPDGDGTLLLKRIREANLDIRVAITTGSSDSLKIRQIKDLKPDLFLLKPIDLDQLFTALQGD